MTEHSSPKKLNLLQMYRGLTALGVLLFHFNEMSKERLNSSTFGNIFGAGWNGVEYFLVLSGFIMIYVHGKEIGQTLHLKSFWLKRVIRIYPIYWILTLVVVGFFLLVPSFATRDNIMTPVYIIKSLLIFPLFFEMQKPILNSAGILNYEIFFYFLFGIAIFFKPKYSLPLLSCWALIVLLFYIKIINFPENWISVIAIFSSLNLEFIMGIIAAYAILHFNLHLLVKYRWIFFWGINAVYILLSLATAYGWVAFDRVACFGVIWTLVIMASTYIDLHDSVKIPFILLYLGEASYSIYLTHGPIVSATTQVLAKIKMTGLLNNILGQSLIVLVTVGIGCVFYSLVEKPLTEYLRKNLVSKIV
jgi:peptidoglycan/LPS O-acetylase OafA/YrhL